jgi:hypothetical protein
MELVPPRTFAHAFFAVDDAQRRGACVERIGLACERGGIGIVGGSGASSISPSQEMRQGTTQFQQGAFAQAAAHWMNAARGI